MCKVLQVTQLKQNCRSSKHKITSILYKDRHMDTPTDRQADSSILPKTFILQGYNDNFCL